MSQENIENTNRIGKPIRIQARVSSKAEWESVDSQPLLEREIGYEAETGAYKIGKKNADGQLLHWNDLPYASFGVGRKVEDENRQALGEVFNDYTNNVAMGTYSHAEGLNTQAKSQAAHTEGWGTVAKGTASHAEGYHTTAVGNYQHVCGKYNDADLEKAVIVGGGNSTEEKNIYTLDWNGNANFAGNITIKGDKVVATNNYVEQIYDELLSYITNTSNGILGQVKDQIEAGDNAVMQYINNKFAEFDNGEEIEY